MHCSHFLFRNENCGTSPAPHTHIFPVIHFIFVRFVARCQGAKSNAIFFFSLLLRKLCCVFAHSEYNVCVQWKMYTNIKMNGALLAVCARIDFFISRYSVCQFVTAKTHFSESILKQSCAMCYEAHRRLRRNAIGNFIRNIFYMQAPVTKTCFLLLLLLFWKFEPVDGAADTKQQPISSARWIDWNFRCENYDICVLFV